MLRVGKENIWRGQGNDFHVDTHTVHVFEAPGDVGHRRRHAKKARAAILDDRLSRGALIEREFGGQVAYLFEVDRRIVMSMEIEFAFRHWLDTLTFEC